MIFFSDGNNDEMIIQMKRKRKIEHKNRGKKAKNENLMKEKVKRS